MFSREAAGVARIDSGIGHARSGRSEYTSGFPSEAVSVRCGGAYDAGGNSTHVARTKHCRWQQPVLPQRGLIGASDTDDFIAWDRGIRNQPAFLAILAKIGAFIKPRPLPARCLINNGSGIKDHVSVCFQSGFPYRSTDDDACAHADRFSWLVPAGAVPLLPKPFSQPNSSGHFQRMCL